MEKHVTALGTLFIALSAMGLVGALITFIAVAGGGLASGEAEAIAITATVGTVVAGFLSLLSIPGIIAGAGLLYLKPWARILALVLCFFNLLNIPFGTAMGIYGIWVLLKDETVRLFNPSAV